MKPLYIFDLDGTLALIDHRRHFVERPSLKCYDCGGANRASCVQCADLDVGWKPNWPAFFAACIKDVPNYPVIRTMEALVRNGADVWIFSGRSDEVREQTIWWLWAHIDCYTKEDFSGSMLRMRQAGDYTPDDTLKRQWLKEMLDEDRERLVAVFDDRDRVVQMWRDEGVTCFQVAQGDF